MKKFTKEELVVAATKMYETGAATMFTSMKDLYDTMRYVLGVHYWGHDFVLRED